MEAKRLHSFMNLKLDQYESKISSLAKQVENQRIGKEVFKEKYEELTEVIQIVDEMRHELKSKKKSF